MSESPINDEGPDAGRVPGRALNLPATRDAGQVEEEIVDGEIVDEAAAPGPGQSAPVRVVVLRPVVVVIQTVTVVVRHEHTRTVARHAAYVPAGVVALARRQRQGRTLAERMAVQLAAQGEHDKAALLLKTVAEERHRRHERSRGRAQMLIDLARSAHWIAIVAVAVMLAIGVAAGNAALMFELTAGIVRAGVTTARWGWRIGVFAVPLAALAVLHEAGRRGGNAPKWARTSAEEDIDVAIDEAAITQALAALRIPQITEYLKTGVPLPYIVGCREEGRGTYAEIRLPKGLPASELAKPARRERLAAGLYRHTKEVWPSVGGDANHLKLWIADKGALEEGAGPYPLLTEGFTDVFKGLPFGKILKGDPARITVIGRNTLCGGMPEQGKSNGARVVTCGYTLDISTEIRIYVPDTNFDFERFKPRCSSYVMGAEDEFIEQIGGELEELKDELQRRGQLLIDAEAEEVTYELAHAGIGLHPVFVLLEEAHVAIQHKQFGKGITQLLVDIVKLDRKRGVHLMLSTQAPTKDSMPRDVTRNCTNGIAYAVGDHVANDALLGQGAYRAGHRATELIPGTDRGTALCKGFGGEGRSEMVQAHRVSGRGDDDQVTPLVQRSLAALAAKGRAVPGTGRGPLALVSRDLLADLATVLAHRGDKVRVADLPQLLRNLAPSWGDYRSLSGTELRARLTDKGVRTTKPENVPMLDPADLQQAVRARESEG